MNKGLLFLLLCIIFTLSTKAQSGRNLFSNTAVHTIKMYTSVPYYWDTMTARYDSSINLTGGVAVGTNEPILFDSLVIDGIRIDSCGVKQKGYYSNWGADTSKKKPLKIEFNQFVAGQRFDGLKDINLANAFLDPSMMRDNLSYKILRDLNLPASRTSYANVYINNVYWSLYVLVEQVGSKFLTEHFGNNNGNLYKVIQSDLTNLGSDSSLYKAEFEKKTNESIDDWSDLIQLIAKINSSPADSIAQYLNLDNFLKTLAVDVSLNNWDSYFEHGRNFYLYNDMATNKFQWIPWDYNLAFFKQDYSIFLPASRDRKPLIIRCFNSPEWKQKYLGYLCELNRSILNLDHLGDFIDNTAALINSSVLADPNGFYTYAQYQTSISADLKEPYEVSPGFWDTTITRGIKPFIMEKQVYILDQFDLEFYTCLDTFNTSIPAPNINDFNMLNIIPNPSAYFVQFISLDGPLSDGLLEITNMNGTQIRRETIHSNIVSIADLTNGIYVLQLIRNNQIFKGKLLVHH